MKRDDEEGKMKYSYDVIYWVHLTYDAFMTKRMRQWVDFMHDLSIFPIYSKHMVECNINN